MAPEDIPTYEDSHELDRRKFHDRRAALPPAPKGGTVGVGPDVNGATAGFNSGDGYGRNGVNGSRYRDERRPAWQRDRGPHARPPAQDRPGNRGDDSEFRRNRVPGRPGGPGGAVGGADVDTYIPAYRGEEGGRRREDRPRDDRRRPPVRDERWIDRDPRTRSRSRSPGLERGRDTYRRRE